MVNDIINKMLGKTKDKDETKFADMKMSSVFGKNPISSFIGKVTNKPISNLVGDNFKFDKKELKAGINIEMEHTRNPLEAEKIAKEHLREIPDYYTRLEKLYKDAKK